MMEPSLDERDRRLVALLRSDAWLTYAALAEKVNLSASAVQRRVERLIDRGVLAGARAIVALPERPRTTLFALVDLIDDSSSTLRKFTEEMKTEPIVAECHYVTGENDVIVRIEVDDMSAYSDFVARRFNGSPLVRRFKTLTSLRPLA